MSDSYVECLVKAKQPAWAKILKVLLVTLTGFSAPFFHSFGKSLFTSVRILLLLTIVSYYDISSVENLKPPFCVQYRFMIKVLYPKVNEGSVRGF